MTFVRRFIEMIVLYMAISFLHSKNIKKIEMAILIWDRVDFRTKTITKDKMIILGSKETSSSRPVHLQS